MIFRIYHKLLGNHVHMRVFAGNGATLACCGTLAMDKTEFAEFQARAGNLFDFVSEDAP